VTSKNTITIDCEEIYIDCELVVSEFLAFPLNGLKQYQTKNIFSLEEITTKLNIFQPSLRNSVSFNIKHIDISSSNFDILSKTSIWPLRASDNTSRILHILFWKGSLFIFFLLTYHLIYAEKMVFINISFHLFFSVCFGINLIFTLIFLIWCFCYWFLVG